MTSQEDKDFSLKDYLLYVPLHDFSLGDMKKNVYLSPDRALTTGKRYDSTEVWLGEPTHLLGLLKGG